MVANYSRASEVTNEKHAKQCMSILSNMLWAYQHQQWIVLVAATDNSETDELGRIAARIEM